MTTPDSSPSPYDRSPPESAAAQSAAQPTDDGPARTALPQGSSTAPSGDPKPAPHAEPLYRRRRMLPLLLFLATCLSTFWVGSALFRPAEGMQSVGRALVLVGNNWQQGLIYMGAVLAILLMHEMGHFLYTVRYRIPASYPIFIPIPFNPIGTMGAVIGMDGLKANRKQLFDIALAGPVAGLLVAVPVLWAGIMQLDLTLPKGGIEFHNPLLVRYMFEYFRPGEEIPSSVFVTQLNPMFMAGWVGLLITGLNMLPISQLDGGHVIYAVFGKQAHTYARAFLIFAIVYIVINAIYIWTLMLILVIIMGVDHPPTSDDSVELNEARWRVGVLSLAIPILCFPVMGIN